MKYWSNPPICSHSHRIHRICSSLRANILLRSYCHHQPPISYPLYWHQPGRMNLRRIFSRQSHPHTILRISLYFALHHCSPCNSPPPIPPRNRIKQPIRPNFRFRQNPFPPLLHNQRYLGPTSPRTSLYNISPILPRPPRRP